MRNRGMPTSASSGTRDAHECARRDAYTRTRAKSVTVGQLRRDHWNQVLYVVMHAVGNGPGMFSSKEPWYAVHMIQDPDTSAETDACMSLPMSMIVRDALVCDV